MTNTNTTHNGYTNYETWAYKLNIDNDSYLCDYYKDLTLQAYEENEQDKQETIWCIKNALEVNIEEDTPIIKGVYADLLNAAIKNINLYEIAEDLYNDYIDDYYIDD